MNYVRHISQWSVLDCDSKQSWTLITYIDRKDGVQLWNHELSIMWNLNQLRMTFTMEKIAVFRSELWSRDDTRDTRASREGGRSDIWNSCGKFEFGIYGSTSYTHFREIPSSIDVHFPEWPLGHFCTNERGAIFDEYHDTPCAASDALLVPTMKRHITKRGGIVYISTG